jgi:triosephosphate isomerase
MRKKIVAANWKMNLTVSEGERLVQDILDAGLRLAEDREVIICPPFPYLTQTRNQIRNYPHFYVGAQNCASEKSGAYTGEVSAAMLHSIAVDYVILGHSERREYFQESGELLRKKISLVLENGLKPLFCCGEPLEIRESEGQQQYVQRQLEESLFPFSEQELSRIVIAYEPIWAIGTGRTATPEQAQQMHAYIRGAIAERYGNEAALQVTILYGGSCKPDNAAELFACPDVDGALVGGASLKAESFVGIIRHI